MGRCVRVRTAKTKEMRNRVWHVREVMRVIKGRDNEREAVKYWPITPSRLETAKKLGDPVVKIARLGAAYGLHQDGSTRHRNMGSEWVEVDELDIVQMDEPGWKEPT